MLPQSFKYEKCSLLELKRSVSNVDPATKYVVQSNRCKSAILAISKNAWLLLLELQTGDTITVWWFLKAAVWCGVEMYTLYHSEMRCILSQYSGIKQTYLTNWHLSIGGADLPNYALTTKPNHNPAVNAGKPQKLLPTKIWAHLSDLETLYFAIRVGNKGKTRYHRGVLGLKVNHDDVYICRRCWGLYLVHQTLTGQVNLASAALSWEVRRPAGFQP